MSVSIGNARATAEVHAEGVSATKSGEIDALPGMCRAAIEERGHGNSAQADGRASGTLRFVSEGLVHTMDFPSLYRQGFLRVAASTVRIAIADPWANAASVLRVARECQRRPARRR